MARATFAAGDKWKAQLRGNVGGFGVGSEFFWQLQADAVYQATDRWQFVFGYRVIDINYDHGSGTGRFPSPPGSGGSPRVTNWSPNGGRAPS